MNSIFFDAMLGSLMDFLPAVALAIILFVLICVLKLKGARNRKLILEEFGLNGNEDEFLRIKGRSSGFWNWILSLFDKAPATIFSCHKNMLTIDNSKIKYNIPLIDITCVSSGMIKSSITLLILGLLFVIIGCYLHINMQIANIPIIGMAIGAILIIIYFLNRRTLYIGIYIGENKPIVNITMKRGIINSIDKKHIETAFNMLNKNAIIPSCITNKEIIWNLR